MNDDQWLSFSPSGCLLISLLFCLGPPLSRIPHYWVRLSAFSISFSLCPHLSLSLFWHLTHLTHFSLTFLCVEVLLHWMSLNWNDLNPMSHENALYSAFMESLIRLASNPSMEFILNTISWMSYLPIYPESKWWLLRLKKEMCPLQILHHLHHVPCVLPGAW